MITTVPPRKTLLKRRSLIVDDEMTVRTNGRTPPPSKHGVRAL